MEKKKIILWGTYDTGKPRVRILRDALVQSTLLDVTEIHADVWRGVEDKSQLKAGGIGHRLWGCLKAYPPLIRSYLAAPKHEVVVVGYMGVADVLVLWLLAKLRGATLVWDMFISVHDTLVDDRATYGSRHPFAWVVYGLEWLACLMADTVVLDTKAHANYVAKKFGLKPEKFTHVPVGAEEKHFPVAGVAVEADAKQSFNVLFYGQFIPLHGVKTIIRAARLCEDASLHWIVIGSGQEAAMMDAELAEKPLANLTRIPWMPYEKLYEQIEAADVCLGIFGSSAKAANVVPNKVYQALAQGKPVITRESPAIAELNAPEGMIRTIPPMDARALVQVLEDMKENLPASIPYRPLAQIRQAWVQLVLDA